MKSEDKIAILQTSPSVSVLESTRKDFEALLSSAYSSSEEGSSKTTKKRPKRQVKVKKNEEPPLELAEMVSSPIKSPTKSSSGVSNSAFWYEKEDKVSSSSSKSSTPVKKNSSKSSSVSSVDHQVMIHGPRSSSSSSHPPLASHSALTTPRYHHQSSEDESNSDPDEPEIQPSADCSVLKVIIHQTDRLIDQPSTKIQPMIIVHAVHPETGRYILHKDSPIPPQFTGSSNSNNTIWNQELTFQLDNLNNTLLLFELVSEQTLLAWGFLRPVSRTGIQHVNKRIQLQLFRIPIRRLFHPSKPTVSDLFTWFKNHRKDKYPATLHVTILPVTSSTIHPEELTNPGSAVIRRNRLEGQPFKLPTRRSFSFGGSDAGSLMARYNPEGSSLAIALTNGDILIYSMGSSPIRLKGHQGNVYDLDWSPSSVLLSCGADSTARIWMNQSNSIVLAHPAFVYSARFINNEVIVTGCYDQLIRLWEVLEDGSVKMKDSYAQHTSPINCLAWDHLKRVLYSGDATGSVCLWNYADNQLEFERILNESSEEQRNKIAVNWLWLHPSGSRLLIQYRGSNLCMVEPKSGIKLLTYSGIFNPRLRLTSCITPCGNYVVAGSEDGSVHWFDLERCDLLAVCTLHGSYQPITAVAFHPTDHAVALCSLNPESAVTVLEFNKEDGAQVNSDAGFSLVTFPRTVQSAAFPIENVSRMTGDSRLIGGNNKTTPTLDKLERIFRKLDLVMAWSHSIEQNDESSIRHHQDE